MRQLDTKYITKYIRAIMEPIFFKYVYFRKMFRDNNFNKELMCRDFVEKTKTCTTILGIDDCVSKSLVFSYSGNEMSMEAKIELYDKIAKCIKDATNKEIVGPIVRYSKFEFQELINDLCKIYLCRLTIDTRVNHIYYEPFSKDYYLIRNGEQTEDDNKNILVVDCHT